MEAGRQSTSLRKLIITELLTTEFTYVQLLKAIEEDFVAPLLHAENQGNRIIPLSDLPIIFQNIKSILSINSRLLSSLKQRVTKEGFSYEDDCVADIFLDLFDSTGLQNAYQQYINNYNLSNECRIRNMKNPKVQQFMTEALKRNFNFPDLQCYLITPIQRLPRYVLLLNDLNKCTGDSHADKQNIVEALARIQEITQQINSGKNFYEKMSQKGITFSRFSSETQRQIEAQVNPEEFILIEGPMALVERSNMVQHYVIVTGRHIIITRQHEKKTHKTRHDLKLIHCLSLLSCNMTFHDSKNMIEMKSLDRIDTPPFMKEMDYRFSTNEQDYQRWKSTLSSAESSNTDSNALLTRASHTRKHLQSVLLNETFVEELSEGAEDLNFVTSGDSLVTEGELNNHVFYIASGSIDVIKTIDSREVVLLVLGPGSLVGDVSFLNFLKTKETSRSSASLVVSQSNTQVLKLSHKLLVKKFREKEELAWRFYFLLCALISERVIRVNSLASQKMSYDHPSQVNQNCKRRARASREISRSVSKIELRTPEKVQRKTKSIPMGCKTPDSGSPNCGKFHNVTDVISEPILHDYPCKFSIGTKKSGSHGYLLLSSNYVCLYKKVFGKKTQILIPRMSINNVAVSSTNSKMITVNHSKSGATGADHFEVFVRKGNEALAIADTLQSFVAKSGSPCTREKISVSSDVDTDIFEKENSYGKDDVLVNPGRISEFIYQLTSGRCRVEIELATGERKIVGMINTGETFCESSFLLGTVTGAFVVADSKHVSVVQCSWQNLSAITLNKAIAANFYLYLAQVLCKRFQTAETELIKSNNAPQFNQTKATKTLSAPPTTINHT